MADIRINALANTATSAASDDYLALDGSANGTRKILATNVAQNVTDVTFGSSGPSAKSSIAARAARQGLVFDGTTVSATATLGSSLGTSDASISCYADVPSTNPSAYRPIYHLATARIEGTPNELALGITTSGVLEVFKRGTTSGDYRAARVTANIVTNSGGKRVHIVITRVGTTLTIFIDGKSQAYTEVTSGTPPTWATTWDGTLLTIGLFGNNFPFAGYIGFVIPYNRALSAAEVVALYEAGVPAGSDYNTASNTALNTGTALNTYSTAWTTFTGASATGFTASTAANSVTPRVIFPLSGTLVAGRRYRVKGTATYAGLDAANLYQANTAYAGLSLISAVSSGAFEFTFTATSGVDCLMFLTTTSASGSHSLTVSGFNLDTPGLLLAPDAGQAGGGLTWYDTSGNAANITLPASGVTWNVPTSSKVATGWSFNGNVGIGTTSPTGYAARLLQINDTSGSTSAGLKLTNNTTGTTSDDGLDITMSGSTAYIIQRENSPLDIYTNAAFVARFAANGNYLLGTTTDGGQKLQVNGNAGFLGHIEIPADKHIYLKDGNPARWSSTGLSSGTLIADIYANSNSLYFRTNGATLALTLDSSQNATFAGQTLKVSPSANDATVSILGRATGTNQAAATSRGATLTVTNLNNTDNNCEAIIFQNSNELAIGSIVAQNVSHSGRTGKLYFNISNGAAPAEAFNIAADKTATFAGAIAIGNTVAAAAGVASTHKVTISIGGVTYYLLASNV